MARKAKTVITAADKTKKAEEAAKNAKTSDVLGKSSFNVELYKTYSKAMQARINEHVNVFTRKNWVPTGIVQYNDGQVEMKPGMFSEYFAAAVRVTTDHYRSDLARNARLIMDTVRKQPKQK